MSRRFSLAVDLFGCGELHEKMFLLGIGFGTGTPSQHLGSYPGLCLCQGIVCVISLQRCCAAHDSLIFPHLVHFDRSYCVGGTCRYTRENETSIPLQLVIWDEDDAPCLIIMLFVDLAT